MNDEQLLIQAKQLNPDALRALHDRFYETVARYIYFKVNDPLTVEDLSGDVFVRVLEGLRKGQAWRESPRGWIMGIARHVVTDYYRQKGKIAEVELNEGVTAAEYKEPTSQILAGEQQEQLQQAIERLTADQRDVILLRFIEGIDIKGVATAINKSPGAVKLLQHRALRRLTELMEAVGVSSSGAGSSG